MLGPTIERQHNEELQPLIGSAFARMVRSGHRPPPPEELQGHELRVEYISMLAQAQRAVATSAVDRFVGSLGVVAGIKPDVVDKFDADRWADEYSDMLGVDPSLIVSGEQVVIDAPAARRAAGDDPVGDGEPGSRHCSQTRRR